MKSKRVMQLLVIAIFSITFLLGARSHVMAASDRENVILVQDQTDKNLVHVRIGAREEASIASFQVGLKIETTNVSNVTFEWNEARKQGQLYQDNYDTNTGTLNLYFVSTNEQNVDKNNPIEVGTIRFDTVATKEATIQVTPMQEKTTASTIGYRATNISVQPEDTLSIVIAAQDPGGNTPGDGSGESGNTPGGSTNPGQTPEDGTSSGGQTDNGNNTGNNGSNRPQLGDLYDKLPFTGLLKDHPYILIILAVVVVVGVGGVIYLTTRKKQK